MNTPPAEQPAATATAPFCPACASPDGVWGRVIHILGWLSGEIPPSPYVEHGRCWRCGAWPRYVLAVCRQRPEDEGWVN